MEFKFYRDLKHSYMVCNCGNDDSNKDARYQLKILESGRVKRLLKCNVRAINQESFLYYDITSMLNIADRYSAKGLNKEQLIKLLSDMKEMMENLSEFLMGEEGIVLDTKNVFINLSSGECCFMYYPYLKEQKSFEEFAEQLLDIVDHDDEGAVDIIYDLCDKAHIKEMLILDILEDILGKNEGVREIKPVIYNKETTNEDYNAYENFDIEEQEDEVVEESRMERSKRVLSGKVQILFFFMFIAVIAGIMYVRMNYILTKEESLLSIGIMLVSGITGAVALIDGIKTMNGHKISKGDKALEDVDAEETYEDYNDYEDENYEAYKAPVRVTSSFSEKNTHENQNDCCDGATIVLTDTDEKAMTLYSTNLDKTIRICLDKLPITIGKMQGCVDSIIPDNSISRMHCRIVKDQNGIALIDLGSTNGSFVNGLKIAAQKKTYIDEGDEVKLGRICFDLR
ncbi:FHA domain-containing protein [Butyrivibrio proteoclasticus]|uniref:FHA domain-containing protein n=1 Tax=Butyrivibrio proteoclasticus TaxID=43305 RepID=A0A1I5WPM0_9FIRM|nr:DUF6382 domain-containing protein [Butyrivibrio proteoclasticus]SFQ21521.1 FHA domain-containing protein [Butyrivibrio proteoclasticus]